MNEILVVKIKKDVYDKFVNSAKLDDYKDDILWAAQDLLMDETSLPNYIRANAELGGLSIRLICSLAGFPFIKKTEEINEEVLNKITKIFEEEYNPQKKWDDIKFLHVRRDAEWEVLTFLQENGFSVDIVYV